MGIFIMETPRINKNFLEISRNTDKSVAEMIIG